MSIKKNKNQLIISIIVGIIIFVITYQFVIKQHEENLKQREEIEKLKSSASSSQTVDEDTTIYVVAKNDIPENHTITSDDVEMKDLGMKTSGVFTDEKLVIGSKTSKEIKAGFPILKSNLDAAKDDSLEPRAGFRALPLAVMKNLLPPFVEENAYVDMYTTNNSIQISNVRVLKTVDSGAKGIKHVLLEIKEEDIPALISNIANTKSGDLWVFAQRNKKERGEYSFSYSYDIGGDFDVNLKNIDYAVEEPAVYTQKGRVQTVELIQGNSKQTLDFE